AATELAQGAGRLVRRATDRGLVAVLDRRLATSRAYRWDLISALPDMPRTGDRDEALDFLARLVD
ncbi:MAG: helicase C-terminal domain-containing protein, partial [Actinomycetota bacterium]|nr:helicase C-terminal domain-containing protein [Actinomycetota bacterium]